MKPYRGKRTDGKDWVYGWYVVQNEYDWDGLSIERHLIYTGEFNDSVEVLPDSVERNKQKPLSKDGITGD